MRIDGQWAICDDGIVRPLVFGEILAGDNSWIEAPFLVDIGADRTVFSAAILSALCLQPVAAQERLSGFGGLAASISVATQVRLTRETGGKVTFRGQYAAATELEALDISVLGRDVLGLFAVIADQPGNLVCLLSQRHRYRIEEI